MKFLADENFPRVAVEALRRAGHDVLWIRDLSPGASDLDVLNTARREERTLLTFDKDFGELVFSLNYQAHQPGAPLEIGIILFRMKSTSPEFLAERVVTAVRARADWAGHFSVVDETGLRVRPYPLAAIPGTGKEKT